MKQVINGKLYNTETAQEICSCQYGYPRDFDYVLEELYRKKMENFFCTSVEDLPADIVYKQVATNIVETSK